MFCGTIEKGLILQVCTDGQRIGYEYIIKVTPKSIRLSDTHSPPLLWTPPSNLPPIGLASVNVKTKQVQLREREGIGMSDSSLSDGRGNGCSSILLRD